MNKVKFKEQENQKQLKKMTQKANKRLGEIELALFFIVLLSCLLPLD
jgi:hypothetical protein